jgi:hypothetical protein
MQAILTIQIARESGDPVIELDDETDVAKGLGQVQATQAEAVHMTCGPLSIALLHNGGELHFYEVRNRRGGHSDKTELGALP